MTNLLTIQFLRDHLEYSCNFQYVSAHMYIGARSRCRLLAESTPVTCLRSLVLVISPRLLFYFGPSDFAITLSLSRFLVLNPGHGPLLHCMNIGRRKITKLILVYHMNYEDNR